MAIDLWTEATYDAEAALHEQRFTAARVATAPMWTFLAAAQHPADFENRLEIVADRIDAVCASMAEGADFAVLRNEINAAYARDFSILNEERLVQEAKRRVAARKQAEENKQAPAGGAEEKDQDTETHPSDTPEGGDHPGPKDECPLCNEDGGGSEVTTTDEIGVKEDKKESSRTAGRYCKTHDVWIGEGNADNHDEACKIEERATDKESARGRRPFDSSSREAASSYSGDPRWITTKYGGTCMTCRKEIPRDSRAWYWPSNKRMECETCGEKSARRFESERGDEDFMNQGFMGSKKVAEFPPKKDDGDKPKEEAKDKPEDKPKEEAPPPAEGDPTVGGVRIGQIQQIAQTQQATEVEGHLVDVDTANMLVQIFEQLNPDNQSKFDDVPLPKLIDWAKTRTGAEPQAQQPAPTPPPPAAAPPQPVASRTAAFDAWVQCSNCGNERKVLVPDDNPEDAGTTFYCPNCGQRQHGIMESERKQSMRKGAAPKTAGFFSVNCLACGKSIQGYPTPPGQEWSSQAVSISDSGEIHIGEYDGYGRIGGADYATEDASVWHKRCWEQAGKPMEFQGKSPGARDQGIWYEAMRKGAPFADYEDFDDCTRQNSDKDDPDAYCGEIKHKTEDKKEAASGTVRCPKCGSKAKLEKQGDGWANRCQNCGWSESFDKSRTRPAASLSTCAVCAETIRYADGTWHHEGAWKHAAMPEIPGAENADPKQIKEKLEDAFEEVFPRPKYLSTAHEGANPYLPQNNPYVTDQGGDTPNPADMLDSPAAPTPGPAQTTKPRQMPGGVQQPGMGAPAGAQPGVSMPQENQTPPTARPGGMP